MYIIYEQPLKLLYILGLIAKASLVGPSGHDEMLHKVQLIALERYKKLKFGLSSR